MLNYKRNKVWMTRHIQTHQVQAGWVYLFSKYDGRPNPDTITQCVPSLGFVGQQPALFVVLIQSSIYNIYIFCLKIENDVCV
jgi:hypothetical protein